MADDFLGIDLHSLDAAQRRNAVSSTLVSGHTTSRWWRQQSGQFQTGVMAEVRQGLQDGLSNSQIATNLRGGIFPTARNKANALVSTSVNAVSNTSRIESFQANDDVIKGMQQLSTFDNRTSDICIAYAGMAWEVKDPHKRLEGTSLPFNGGPPRHFNCRSTLIPITKTFEELGIPGEEIAPSTRASIDGQIPEDITFAQFLKSKPDSFADNLLGPARAKLFREDRITLNQLVDMRGNPLSVKELANLSAARKKSLLPDPKTTKFESGPEWYKTFNDPDVTVESVLARGTPEQRKSIARFEELIDAGTDTETLYWNESTEKWAFQRRVVHDRILHEKIFTPAEIARATPPPGQKPTVTFLGGRGGSGKSFLTEGLDGNGKGAPIDISKTIVLNSDNFKELLPEWDGWNAALLHEESSYLMNLAKDFAVQHRVNVVLDVTMNNIEKTGRQLAQFEAAGYNAEAFYMHLPRQEAAFRALGRSTRAKNPRYVPTEIILDSIENEGAWQKLVDEGRVSRWGFYDNQVPMGSNPRFISGQLDIDPEALIAEIAEKAFTKRQQVEGLAMITNAVLDETAAALLDDEQLVLKLFNQLAFDVASTHKIDATKDLFDVMKSLNLTVAEGVSIMHYASGSFRSINRSLRGLDNKKILAGIGGKRAELVTVPNIEAAAVLTNRAINKMPKFKPGQMNVKDKPAEVLYRGFGTTLSNADLDATLDKYARVEPGAVITEDAIMSTSMVGSGSRDGPINFVLHEAKTGAPIIKLSTFISEDEVVFASGSKWRLLKVEAGKRDVLEGGELAPKEDITSLVRNTSVSDIPDKFFPLTIHLEEVTP